MFPSSFIIAAEPLLVFPIEIKTKKLKIMFAVLMPPSKAKNPFSFNLVNFVKTKAEMLGPIAGINETTLPPKTLNSEPLI